MKVFHLPKIFLPVNPLRCPQCASSSIKGGDIRGYSVSPRTMANAQTGQRIVCDAPEGLDNVCLYIVVAPFIFINSMVKRGPFCSFRHRIRYDYP